MTSSNFRLIGSEVDCFKKLVYETCATTVTEQIVLEGAWAQTADGHNFLLANDGDQDKMLICGSVEGLAPITQADTIYFDETFYTAPHLFAQLYTLHAISYGQMFPLAYGMLPDRRQNTYQRFIHLIVEADATNDMNFDPDITMVDYEMGAIRAYQYTLPNTEVRGCLFHYGQAIIRAVQRVGLQVQYQEAAADDPLKRWIRRTTSLPLIPLHDFNAVWDRIMADAPQINEANAFRNYVDRTWMDQDAMRYNRVIWNQYDRLQESRTINALEGWHHKLNTYVGKAHPNIFELILFLKKEECYQRTELLRLEAAAQTPAD
jgi:hypothetical protein